MIRTLHRIGVRPPRPFNPKKDKNFENWLSRVEYHFALMGLNEERCTAALLLQLDPDALEIARYLGITPATGYKEAVGKLKDHYALTETPEELREKFTHKVQESNESLEDFAWEVRVLASRAFKGIENTILETLMLKQIVDGLRNSNTRERLIVKRPATLTEAVHFARISEMATRLARGNKTGAPVAAVTPNRFHKPGNEYQQQQYQGKQFNQATGFGEYNSFKGGYQSPQAGTSYNKNFGPKQQGKQNFQRFPQGNFGRNTLSPRPPNQQQQQVKFTDKCFKCGRVGHKAKFCRSQGGEHAVATTVCGEESQDDYNEGPSEREGVPRRLWGRKCLGYDQCHTNEGGPCYKLS